MNWIDLVGKEMQVKTTTTSNFGKLKNVVSIGGVTYIVIGKNDYHINTTYIEEFTMENKNGLD